MNQPAAHEDAARPPVIWVLADDRAGNRAQCLGVAERLGLDYLVKEIRYTGWVKLPNMLRGASLKGITAKSKARLKAPWPDVVIAAGRRTAPVARWIKRRSPETRLMQLMWPDAGMADFDCIVLPSHDRDHADSGNILRILGAPHRITPHVLEEAEMEWQPKLTHLPPLPKLALLIGGSTRHGRFSNADFHRLGTMAKAFATAIHGTILLTTSRRTGREGEKILQQHLETLPNHSHNWNAPNGEKNPYLGYLALADGFIVTADSIAMCSEACATHKPVFIYQPRNLSAKHKRFVNTLIGSGYAYPLEEEFLSELHKPLTKKPLDSAATIAAHIRTQWLEAEGNSR